MRIWIILIKTTIAIWKEEEDDEGEGKEVKAPKIYEAQINILLYLNQIHLLNILLQKHTFFLASLEYQTQLNWTSTHLISTHD